MNRDRNILIAITFVLVFLFCALTLVCMFSDKVEAIENDGVTVSGPIAFIDESSEYQLNNLEFDPIYISEETSKSIEIEESDPKIEQQESLIFCSDVPLSEDFQEYLYHLCEDYSIPYELALAIIDTESKFTIDAISGTSDYGLMQINQSNFFWLADTFGIYYDKNATYEEQLDYLSKIFLDPYTNVQAGLYLISINMEYANNDISLALMSYNCGPGGAQALWEQGIYSNYYSEIVMESLYYYKALLSERN